MSLCGRLGKFANLDNERSLGRSSSRLPKKKRPQDESFTPATLAAQSLAGRVVICTPIRGDDFVKRPLNLVVVRPLVCGRAQRPVNSFDLGLS